MLAGEEVVRAGYGSKGEEIIREGYGSNRSLFNFFFLIPPHALTNFKILMSILILELIRLLCIFLIIKPLTLIVFELNIFQKK